MLKRWTDFIIALNWSAVEFSVEAAGQMTDRKRRLSELRGLLTVIKGSPYIAAGCMRAALVRQEENSVKI